MQAYDILLIILVFVLSILSGYFITPFFIDIFTCGKSVAKNYRGELVPQGIGVVFALCSLIWYVLYLFIFDFLSTMAILALFGFFVMSLVGFMDDMLGSREVTGIKGHFSTLLKDKKLTTGAVKAITGLLVAVAISAFFSINTLDLIINSLIIALSTNLLNLFDLRPGRAIKFYIFLILIFIINALLTGKLHILAFFLPLIGFVSGYFPYDLKAKCMMGDAGSNVLGISIGMLTILQLESVGKLVYLALLLLIHLFAERHSISDLIDNNKFLHYIDNWGR